ncbi:Murein DD-endopeptidase MepM and murein hydrolase activator NlpD, contain LysM domain [Flavobacteriaceae bacterium MAR_2010_188]|nr:Murein DD-endopeptidase MepM and murein hydrolase activator NlpD, contain LysM domain [Flavobacteriaceae bacterium MAR_2010_188]
MKNIYQSPYLYSIFLLFFFSCKQVQKVTDIVIQPTEREKYARNFGENDSLYIGWTSEFEIRKGDSLSIDLPYAGQGTFSSYRNEVLSYDFQLQEGERLVLELDRVPDSSKVFVNIYDNSDSKMAGKSELFEGLVKNRRNVLVKKGTNSIYKIVLQPELSIQSEFILKIYTEATYSFPVAGHTSKNTQSFWGASRDGGKRSHEGIDIFAERGTPVVAAVDGRVRKTGEYGLGGKQVWLKEGMFGNSLYYAHLDSIAVETGKSVKIGDTLGFVGNTGNARTTAPHLHFGIYQGYHGAINPFPFIKETEFINIEAETIAISGTIKSPKANIRIGPSTIYAIIITLEEASEVEILSKSNDWYQIVLPSGLRGFIHESLIVEKAEDLSA